LKITKREKPGAKTRLKGLQQKAHVLPVKEEGILFWHVNTEEPGALIVTIGSILFALGLGTSSAHACKNLVVFCSMLVTICM
jgi:hypothetical protein